MEQVGGYGRLEFARQDKWLRRPSDSFILVALAEKQATKIAEAAGWNTTQQFRKILTGCKMSGRR